MKPGAFGSSSQGPESDRPGVRGGRPRSGPNDREPDWEKTRKRLLGRPLATATDASVLELADALEESLLLQDFDAAERILEAANRDFPLRAVLIQVITPALEQIGTAWEKGYITVAMEHAATALLRRHINRHLHPPASRPGPRVVCTTLPDERHEGGAMIVAVLLSRAGFTVDYLGPDTPIQDLAAFARKVNADAIIVSASTPGPVVALARGAFSGFPAPVLIGGAGADGSKRHVEQTGAVYLGATMKEVPKIVEQHLGARAMADRL